MGRFSFAQVAIISLGLAWGFGAIFGYYRHIVARSTLLSDFIVFWTAGRVDQVYDAVALTRAQDWLLPIDPGLRPFPYPPSTLLFLKPFAWLDFGPAAVVWIGLGITAFVTSAALYVKRPLLVLLSPAVVLSVMTGQMSLFLGSAMSAGVAILDRKPRVAGVLFGVIAAVKPQFAMLVPVALIAGSHWRVLAIACVTGLAIVAMSIALGPSLWPDWVSSLPGFVHQVRSSAYDSMNASPGLWFAPIGLLSVAVVYNRTTEPDVRLIVLVSGTCLSVPYMMSYDLAAMAPAALAMMLGRKPIEWIVGLIAFAFSTLSPIIVFGVWIVVALRARFDRGLVVGLASR